MKLPLRFTCQSPGLGLVPATTVVTGVAEADFIYGRRARWAPCGPPSSRSPGSTWRATNDLPGLHFVLYTYLHDELLAQYYTGWASMWKTWKSLRIWKWSGKGWECDNFRDCGTAWLHHHHHLFVENTVSKQYVEQTSRTARFIGHWQLPLRK